MYILTLTFIQPSSLKKIGDYAFGGGWGHYIKDIVIQKNVIEVGKGAFDFEDERRDLNVTLLNPNTIIGEDAFYNTAFYYEYVTTTIYGYPNSTAYEYYLNAPKPDDVGTYRFVPITPEHIKYKNNGTAGWVKTANETVYIEGTPRVGTLQYQWTRGATEAGSWVTIPTDESSNDNQEFSFTVDAPKNSGVHHLYVRYTSESGRKIEESSMPFLIDNSNPEGSIEQRVGEDSVVLKLVGTDKDSGVKRVRVKNGTWVEGNLLTYTTTKNGVYTFEIEDNAGNIGTVSIEVTTFENVPGETSLTVSDINPFRTIILTDKPTTYTTTFKEPFKITNTVTPAHRWRLDVSAKQFSIKQPTSGFIEGTSVYQLPKGTLSLKLANITRLDDYKEGGKPTISLVKETVIDNGAVTVVTSDEVTGFGEFELTFPEDALSVLIDPTTALVGNPPTFYETTITWDLIKAP